MRGVAATPPQAEPPISEGAYLLQARVLFPHSRVINLDIQLNAIQLQKTTRLQATPTTPYRGV